MLQVKNLTKIYKPKKGAEVTALDDISLDFPEKGMIFLLGKSGSGKSTLLNLLGGLDKYTSGEIIIKGKSSKDFTNSDFDSYRNTFIGFIFQEFNVLEEYNVAKNIELSITLQHKKVNKEKVLEIMQDVDLEKEYYSRNINELSGGQKQRVAIARAIVKNPDIIMADEPTGALDSKTGKQVFDTLKKLSKEKLVIVVSHDKENAEIYGDRIIELADGKIIGDRTHFDDKKEFVPTKKEDIKIKEYKKEDFKLVKGKLPIKESIKMGLSSLKYKKFRLCFAIFLSFVAFTIFGSCITAANFDALQSNRETAKLNGENVLVLDSIIEGEYSFDTGIIEEIGIGFSDEQIEKIEQITGNKTLNLYRQRQEMSDKWSFNQNFAKMPECMYYATSFKNFVEIENEKDANLIPVAEGSRLPQSGNFNEIAISDWVADGFVENGLLLNDEEIEINNYDDLINKTIKVNLSTNTLYDFTITGVYKTDINKENYYEYKEQRKFNWREISKFNALNNLIISMGYVAPDFEFIYDYDQTKIFLKNWEYKIGNTEEIEKINYFDTINSADVDLIYCGEKFTGLKDNEVIVSTYLFDIQDYQDNEIKNYFDNLSEEDKTIELYNKRNKLGQYKIVGISKIRSETIYFSNSKFQSINKIIEKDSDMVNYNNNFEYGFAGQNGKSAGVMNVINAETYNLSNLDVYWGENNSPKTSLEDDEVIVSSYVILRFNDMYQNENNWTKRNFMEKYDDIVKDMEFGRIVNNGRNSIVFKGKNVKIVGYSYDSNVCLVGKEIFDYAKELNESPKKVLIKLSDNWSSNKELFNYFDSLINFEKGKTINFKLNTSGTEVIDMIYYNTQSYKKVVLYLSLIFSIFAGLLLMNFIGVSVANKKKEIGILRAMGATNFDVFKIFISEGLAIGLINFVLSYVAVVVLSVVFNKMFLMSIFIPGIVVALLMLALSLVVVTFATLIPTIKIARKKPIDAINNK